MDSIKAKYPGLKFVTLEEVKKLPDNCKINIIYLRVSTDEQAKLGYSINDQLMRVLDWIVGKEWNQYPILILVDNPGSGSIGWFDKEKPNLKWRKGFDNLWLLVKQGRVANITTAYFDRLSRNDKFTINLVYECDFQNSHIHCVDKGEFMDRPENRLSLMITSAVATEQARGGRVKVRESIDARIKQGLPPGKVPFGWKNHIRTEEDIKQRKRPNIEPNEEQKKVLLMIKDWFMSGMSYCKIVAKLNAQGIPSPRGKTWCNGIVISILLNPFHTGSFRYNGKILEGEHAKHAFWSSEDLENIKCIHNRRKKTNPPFVHSDEHKLGGLIICGKCGSSIRYQNVKSIKGGPRYFCENGCKGVRARVNLVDKYVTNQVRELASLKITQEIALKEVENLISDEYDNPMEIISNLEGNKSKIESALKLNYDGWTKGYADEDLFLAVKKKYDIELADVEKELLQYRSMRKQRDELTQRVEDVMKILPEFDRIWTELNREEQREILSLSCESLVLDCGDNYEAILKIKTLFMPEKKHIIPSHKFGKTWKIGPYEGLLVSWLSCAKLIIGGLSFEETRKQRNLSRRTTRVYLWNIAHAIGVETIEEALEKIKPYIDEIEPELLMREKNGSSRGNSNPPTQLEIEALRTGAKSKNVKEASDKLGVCRSTYSSRIWTAYQKLGAHNLKDAIIELDKRGI